MFLYNVCGDTMKRKIEQDLIQWKNKTNKKPLIIKGARQVGKTYSIREFARIEYAHLIEINFEKDLPFREIFQKTHNPKDLIPFFELSFPSIPLDHTTLFFMDEVQACPDALTTLKFMAEDFPCDIICSGNLLGVAIAKTTSFPVGYVESIQMFPLSFQEFLDALQISSSLLDFVKKAITNQTPLPEILHEKMNELFNTYMLVGGMPAVVKEYIETKSFANTLNMQRRIVNDYLNDMIKYASANEALRIRECFSSIPLQLAKENQKFQYSLIHKGYNARHYYASLTWLEDSGLILKVHRLSNIQHPLKIQQELAVFKVFMSDSGLLLSQLDDETIRQILLGNLGIYKGAIYENIIAQTFALQNKTAYYYEPNQHSEIDFIIEYEGHITPIEIKAGKHTTSVSFKNFVKKYHPEIAFRLSQKNIGKDDDLNTYFYPLYALEFILDQEKKLFELPNTDSV